jgi:hypothetical protein
MPVAPEEATATARAISDTRLSVTIQTPAPAAATSTLPAQSTTALRRGHREGPSAAGSRSESSVTGMFRMVAKMVDLPIGTGSGESSRHAMLARRARDLALHEPPVPARLPFGS